jgi:hypothetical protein
MMVESLEIGGDLFHEFYFYSKTLDAEVVSGLKSSVSDERKKTTAVLEFLRELDRRKLYADFNCESLLKRVQALRSHAQPSMSRIELLEYMADEVLKSFAKLPSNILPSIPSPCPLVTSP